MFYPSIPFNFGGTSLLIPVVSRWTLCRRCRRMREPSVRGMMQKPTCVTTGGADNYADHDRTEQAHESRASVKKICRNCKIAAGVVRVICTDAAQAASGPTEETKWHV